MMSFKGALNQFNLSADVVDRIVEEHNNTLKNEYIPKARFDNVNTEKGELKTQVDALNQQIADLKKFEGTNEEMQTKLTQMQEEAKAKEEQWNAASTERDRKYAVMVGMINSKDYVPHDMEMVYNMLDKDMLVFGSDNQLKGGLEEAHKKLAESKPFLYQSVEEKVEQKPANPFDGWNTVGKQLPKGDPDPQKPAGQNMNAAEFGKNMAQEMLRSRGIKSNK